ncbi:hypothetical protein P7K49_024742, partial [Saguinus oedipus]
MQGAANGFAPETLPKQAPDGTGRVPELSPHSPCHPSRTGPAVFPSHHHTHPVTPAGLARPWLGSSVVITPPTLS